MLLAKICDFPEYKLFEWGDTCTFFGKKSWKLSLASTSLVNEWNVFWVEQFAPKFLIAI